MKLNNKYFFLRHGKNIHQTEKKDIVYGWPDDKIPCSLIEEGVREVEKSAEILKEKNIDLIFASDIKRTRQTAQIVADKINKKVNLDERLRDTNWGILQGKSKKEAWEYFSHDMKKRFKETVPNGESWDDCQRRMVDAFKDIEKKHKEKNILIVSHMDPLWLLEGWIKGWDEDRLLEERINKKLIKTAEIREIC